MTKTLSKILVRYWIEKEWSGTDGEYDEKPMPTIKTLMDSEGKGKITTVQCYRQFSGSYYYILLTVQPLNNPHSGEVKWLLHLTDEKKETLVLEKCRSFSPATLDHLTGVDTKCDTSFRWFLETVVDSLLSSDTEDLASEEFARICINMAAGKEVWLNIAGSSVQFEAEEKEEMVPGKDRTDGELPDSQEQGCGRRANPGQVVMPSTELTFPSTMTNNSLPSHYQYKNEAVKFWDGIFLYRKGECIDLFRGSVDETTTYLTTQEMGQLLGTERIITHVSLCGVYIRNFVEGRITWQSTLACQLIMVKIRGSTGENDDGTWRTFFLNGYHGYQSRVMSRVDNSSRYHDKWKGQQFHWYVLLQDHGVSDIYDITSTSQLIDIKQLKVDRSEHTVGQFCVFLQDKYIPEYQKECIPGDTFSFSVEIYKYLSLTSSHLPRCLRQPGPYYNTEWEGKLVLKEGWTKQEYHVNTILLLCWELDPDKSIMIREVHIYKSPLLGICDIYGVAYHPFVVFRTDEGSWWSLEKFPDGLRLTHSPSRDCLFRERIDEGHVASKCSGDKPKLLISDMSRRGLFAALMGIKERGELQAAYVATTDNCMRFAENVFNSIAFEKRWKVPPIPNIANKVTSKILRIRSRNSV